MATAADKINAENERLRARRIAIGTALRGSGAIPADQIPEEIERQLQYEETGVLVPRK